MASFLDTLPGAREVLPAAPPQEMYELLICLCEMHLRLVARLDVLVHDLEQRDAGHEQWRREHGWEQGRLEQRRALTAAKLAGDAAAAFRADLAIRESFEDQREAERWIAEREAAAFEEARKALRPALRVVS